VRLNLTCTNRPPLRRHTLEKNASSAAERPVRDGTELSGLRVRPPTRRVSAYSLPSGGLRCGAWVAARSDHASAWLSVGRHRDASRAAGSVSHASCGHGMRSDHRVQRVQWERLRVNLPPEREEWMAWREGTRVALGGRRPPRRCGSGGVTRVAPQCACECPPRRLRSRRGLMAGSAAGCRRAL